MFKLLVSLKFEGRLIRKIVSSIAIRSSELYVDQTRLHNEKIKRNYEERKDVREMLYLNYVFINCKPKSLITVLLRYRVSQKPNSVPT